MDGRFWQVRSGPEPDTNYAAISRAAQWFQSMEICDAQCGVELTHAFHRRAGIAQPPAQCLGRGKYDIREEKLGLPAHRETRP